MVKQTQTIRRQVAGSALKGLSVVEISPEGL